MLLTVKEAQFLEKYMIPLENSDKYHCKDPKNVPAHVKKELLERDEEFQMIYGYHMIDNYEELK